MTVLVDNSPPDLATLSLDYTSSNTIRVMYDGWDARSSFYTSASAASGYNGIKNFTLTLKNQAGTTVANPTLDATVYPRVHVFSSLSPNTNYSITVTAIDLVGNSRSSNPETAKTKPGAPTNFIASTTSYCSVTLTWDAMPGAISYNVSYNSNSPVSTVAPTYTFTGLSPNTLYNFKVTAMGNDGLGDTSNKNISTQAISSPTFQTSLNICGSSQTVQVSPINSASSYNWTVSSPLTINGAQTCSTTSNSATIQTNGFLGTSTISVTANTSCGTSSNTATGVIFAGHPIVVSSAPLAYFDGYTYNNVCNLQQTTTNMIVEGASNIYWSKLTSFPSNISWWQPGNNVSFYFYDINQTAVFNVTASNGCGTTSYDFGFKSINCGGGGGCDIEYIITPNPASNKVKIVPNIPPPCESMTSMSTNGFVSVYDQSGTLKKKVKYNQISEIEVDISNLRNGVYFLEIYSASKITKKTFIVKH